MTSLSSDTKRIIVFTKYPVPGKTKTRLIPLLGEAEAADLHREMSEYIIRIIEEYCRQNSAFFEIRFDGGEKDDMKSWLGDGMSFIPQGEGNIGERMKRATDEAFRLGAGKVVVVGTDCPEISIRLLREAFHHLGTRDVVIGPAVDGGYYLVGLNRPAPGLFDVIDWSTHRVLAQTIERAREFDLDLVMLETLSDIDRPQDYPLWEKIKGEDEKAAEA